MTTNQPEPGPEQNPEQGQPEQEQPLFDPGFLAQENRGLFKKLSGRAKGIAGAFLGLPGARTIAGAIKPRVDSVVEKVDRHVGERVKPTVRSAVETVHAGCHEFWMHRAEEKRSRLEGEIKSMESLVNANKNTIAQMDDLTAKNPAFSMDTDSLKLKKETLKLADKIEAKQGEIEKMEAKAKRFEDQRNAVADRYIAKYDTKFEKMKAEREKFRTLKSMADTRVAVMEARHKQTAKIIDGLENQKLNREKLLKLAGRSERQIKYDSAVENIDKQINSARGRLKKEKDYLIKEQAKITKKFDRGVEETTYYENKKKGFERTGQVIPLDTEVRYKGIRIDRAESKRENEGEDLRANLYISRWNAFIKDLGPDSAALKITNPGDFRAKMGIDGDTLWNFEDFVKAINTYLYADDVEKKKGLAKTTDEFFDKKIKTGEGPKEELEIGAYISRWNAFLGRKGSAWNGLHIDSINEFNAKKGVVLSEHELWDFDDFGRIFGSYFADDINAQELFDESVDEFFEQINTAAN